MIASTRNSQAPNSQRRAAGPENAPASAPVRTDHANGHRRMLRPLLSRARSRPASFFVTACLLSACLILPAVPFTHAAAQDTDAAGGRDQLEQLEQALANRKREEARLKDEAAARAREVAALSRNMVETATALQAAEARITDIMAELTRLESEEKTLSSAIVGERETLGDVLAALQSLERSRPPALLVSPDDAAKAARLAMLLADAAPTIEAKARTLRNQLDALRSVRAQLDEERANAVRTNAEIAGRRQTLADILRTKRRERDVAQRLAAAAQSETAALAARASTLSDVINRLERLARSITPRLKPRAPGAQRGSDAVSIAKRGPVIPFTPTRSFSEARGALRAPVAGDIIGQFGQLRPEGGQFDGLRYRAQPNAIVTAPFQASIAFARSWGPIGNLIVLDVGGGYHILLLGVGAILVEEGQTVAAGEPVATMPGDDSALDLEIRRNRVPVNPLTWLAGQTG